MAQLLGTGLAVALVRFLYPSIGDVAAAVVVPHPRSETDSGAPAAAGDRSTHP